MLNQSELTYNTPTQQLLPILKHPEEVQKGSVQLNHLEGVYSDPPHRVPPEKMQLDKVR